MVHVLLILMEHIIMVMKLSKLKALFHPVWDTPEDDVEVRFLAPGMGGKWEMHVGDASYDVAKKLWTVDLRIGECTGEANTHHHVHEAPVDAPTGDAGPEPIHQHGDSPPHSHDFGGAKHTHEDGIPVADEHNHD